MSDERVENTEAPEGSAGTPELSRKEKAAARRAEFEVAKAAKKAEKAAATAAAREEKLAAKQAHDELRAAAKADKKAARAAKKAEKTSGATAEDADFVATKEKKEKDPYRPRFAVAPVKVRAFTILAAAFALVHAAGAVLLLLESTSSPVLGVVPPDVPSMLVYVGAAVSLVVAGLWTASASLLCAGRVHGKYLGVVVLVLGLPLSLVAAPLLFSDDVGNWAL